MKLVFFLLFFGGYSMGVLAQQNHFIYLQTDDKQPFYVTINQTVYSSSASGYAIIPRLQKGEYILQIGFPKNRWPEQSIQVPVETDAGYALKNFGEKGWGLFNFQSLQLLMASNKTGEPATAVQTPNAEENAFASTLAGIVNTPDLATKTVVETPKPEATTVQPLENPAVVEVTPLQEETNISEPPAETVAEPIAAVKSTASPGPILKLSEVVDAEGFAMRYSTQNGAVLDTVQIFIPDSDASRTQILKAETQPLQQPTTEKQISVSPATVNTTTQREKESVTSAAAHDARFLDIEMPLKPAPGEKVKDTLTKQEEKTSPEANTVEEQEKAARAEKAKQDEQKTRLRTDEIPESKPVVSINSDCKKFANEDDFLKTRRRMAAEPDAESMIQSAKKRFKSACYSTEQIKNLSVLFLKDETRYNFFDAAYPFVSDAENFSHLESLLTDEYYINRFKAMIR